jgi:methyl coenzyme M reductase subunit C-like uncharacterized protein (methanogenesis marker protein 7)
LSKNGFIHSVTYFDVKNKYDNYLTAIHDVKIIDKNLSNINKVNNKSNYYHLSADKSYIIIKISNKTFSIKIKNKMNI